MAPFCSWLRNSLRTSDWVCSSQARRRQHHVVAVLVQLDDLGLDLLADVRLQIADTTHLDQRRGQEAAQADVEDQAALDDLDDGALDGLVLLLELLDGAPGALVLSALLGQDQAAFFVLLGEDQGFDLIADGHNLIGVDVVLDGEFAGGDDTFGLVADVEQDFVAVDLDDGPFDDVAIVEVLDGLVDGGEKVLGRANVVDGYLRRGDGGTWHIVGLLRTGLIVGTVWLLIRLIQVKLQPAIVRTRVPVETTRLGTRWTNSVSRLTRQSASDAQPPPGLNQPQQPRPVHVHRCRGGSARSAHRSARSSRWAPSPG